jgi:hypothetical protein
MEMQAEAEHRKTAQILDSNILLCVYRKSPNTRNEGTKTASPSRCLSLGPNQTARCGLNYSFSKLLKQHLIDPLTHLIQKEKIYFFKKKSGNAQGGRAASQRESSTFLS